MSFESSSSRKNKNADASDCDGDNTPKRQRLDSQGSEPFTPAKKRLTFDFWAEGDSQTDSESKMDVDISELKDIALRDVTKHNCENGRLLFRCSYKGDLRRTTSSAYFLFHGYDGTSEIGFKAFGSAAENFYSRIKVNNVYAAKDYTVEEETAKWPSTTQHKCHCIFHETTILEELEDNGDIPKLDFNFVKIETIPSTPAKTKIDIIGILVKIYKDDATSNGSKKRDIAITDAINSTVNITLWGSTAEMFEAELFSVLAIRKGKVSEWQQIKSISASDGCTLWENPNTAEAAALKEWFEKARAGKNRKN